VRVAFERRVNHANLLARQHGGQDQLGHVLGERRDGREYQRGRAAEEHRDGERLSGGLGLVVVEAAALVYLPVHPRRARVEALHAVHAEVVLGRRGVLGVDEREREEGASVLLPCRQHGQLVEPRGPVNDLRDRRARDLLRPELQGFERERAVLPERGGLRRQE
jgi:hypothetical protein